MFLVRIDGSFCSGDTMSIYTSPATITICSILSSKAIQRLLSPPVEEERSSSAGRRHLRRKGHRVCALGPFETADFKQRSSGQAYWQRCDGPLIVQEARRPSWNAPDRAAERTTSSRRSGCIHRTSDHALVPAAELRSRASRPHSLR
jgi:hypothetical protein